MLSALLHLPITHMTGLLLLAVLLGGLVGWERERHARPAGLRTHVLVCVGAALMTLVSRDESGGRIAAQIVTGVGFLGAGTIIRESEGGAVRGLTTAASLWAIAGVGIAVGYGGLYAQLATAATLIVLLTLTVLNGLEGALDKHRRRQSLALILATDCDALPTVTRLLDSFHHQGIHTRDLKLSQNLDSPIARLELSLPAGVTRERLDTLLREDKDVLHHEWPQ